MGCSTDALVHIRFSGETFDSLSDVEEYIDERKDEISRARDTLSQLAWMTEPKKFCEKEESPEFYIKNNLDWALDQLEEAAIEKYKAQLVKNAWDHMHHENGGCLDTEESFDELQRLWGDFLVMVKQDGSNRYPDDKMHTDSYNRMIEMYERHKKWIEQRNNSANS